MLWRPINRERYCSSKSTLQTTVLQTHEGNVTYVPLLVHVWDWTGTPTTDKTFSLIRFSYDGGVPGVLPHVHPLEELRQLSLRRGSSSNPLSQGGDKADGSGRSWCHGASPLATVWAGARGETWDQKVLSVRTCGQIY